MKNTVKSLLAVCIAALALRSCKEQYTTYGGDEYVMFADTVMTYAVQKDVDYFSIPVVSTVAADHERTFGVEILDSKSNAIVLARNGMLLGSGVGQTSRVDALRQAIAKAGSFDLDLHRAAMASDAFFPFADCVEIADAAGVTAVIQPGGSIRDNDTIEYCRAHNITIAITGYRHFRH